MRRCLLVACFALFPVLAARGDSLSNTADRGSTSVASRIGPHVLRFSGLRTGRVEASGVAIGDGSLALAWTLKVSPGRLAVVKVADREVARAEVLAWEAGSDVALLSVDPPLPIGGLGAGGALRAGSPVFSAGHPFGTLRGELGPAVAQGIVAQARLGADGEPERYLLSNRVNPGEFGGPLVDRWGRLAGILLPRQDRTSKLSTAAPIGVLRAAFAEIPGAAAAFTVVDVEGTPDWPVHDRLREVAVAAFPAVLSVRETRTDVWFTAVLIDREGRAVATKTGLPPERELEAVLPDGRRLAGKVLGTSEQLRISLLRFTGEDLPAPPPLATEAPPVGAFVVGVGNVNGDASGRGPLLSMGLVGARGRSELRYGALLTDADVNLANDGGPLLDLDGRLVGFLTTLGGDSLEQVGANSGLGFVIPAAAVASRLDELEKGADIPFRPGYLGVTLDLEYPDGDGVAISAVQPGFPAAKAGFEPGDLLTAIGGEPVNGVQDLRRVFTGLSAGDEVEIRVRRGDEELDLKATLALRPGTR